ncbi:MAG: hypothetical protein ACFFDY_00140 [Candidatus Thorarchaeota archaeon]
MILEEYCIFRKNNKDKRKELNEKGWISSVKLSRFSSEFSIPNPIDYNLKRMREFCKTSRIYDCIKLNISGTIKYWFKKDQIKNILEGIK